MSTKASPTYVAKKSLAERAEKLPPGELGELKVAQQLLQGCFGRPASA